MTWAIGAVIALVAVMGAVTAVDPAGWFHRGGGGVTLRSSSGVVLATSARGRVLADSRESTASAANRVTSLPRPSTNLPAIAPLSAVRETDAAVILPTTINPGQVAKLVKVQGLSAVEEVDSGTVSLAGAPAVTIGVDPGTFRQFTPRVTASEDRLWRYVAGGSLVSSYEMASDRALPLGRELPVVPAGAGLRPTKGWLGALASLGLPGVDMVVSHAYSGRLGLVPDSGLIVSAPNMDPYALSAELSAILPGADVELLHPAQATGSADSPALPGGTLGSMLTAALSRVGRPYVYGGTGPDVFDCSGLVQWSFARAGVMMPRTAAEQYLTGPRLSLAQARPGDLLFWAYDPGDPTFVDHVAIYLGHGMEVEAPHTGLNVEVIPVPTAAGFAGAVRVDPAGATAHP